MKNTNKDVINVPLLVYCSKLSQANIIAKNNIEIIYVPTPIKTESING